MRSYNEFLLAMNTKMKQNTVEGEELYLIFAINSVTSTVISQYFKTNFVRDYQYD